MSCRLRLRVLILSFVLLPLLCSTQQSFAAGDSELLGIEFVSTEGRPQSGGTVGASWAIYLDGRIDEGAAGRLRDELARREVTSAAVYLNSRGGDLGQGMELGRLIRERGFSTYVGRQNDRGWIPFAGECYSACVFAFIGGNYRFYSPRSRIGVHRFSSLSPADSDADTAQIVSAAIVNYIRKMEVDVGLFERMSRAGKDQILILGKADLEKLRVTNDGRQAAEWAIDSVNGATYLKGAQQTAQGMGTILLSCSDGGVLFRPMFETGDSAKFVAGAVTQHLIRFGDGYVPLSDPLQPVSIQDGSVSAEFSLSREQIRSMQNSASVGYALKMQNPAVIAGFAVDTAGSGMEKIRGFLKNCER